MEAEISDKCDIFLAMKSIKNSEVTAQKAVRKEYGFKKNVVRGYNVERRKQKGKFDKNCLSETDMDEILAIG